MTKETLVFDIETNGLLDELDAIHCISIYNVEQKKQYTSSGSSVLDALPLLTEAETLVGHNIIDFDIPAIQKLVPSFQPQGLVRDTLVMSRLIWPDTKEKDYERGLPNKLVGSHSLKAWGLRLGNTKGDFEGPWDTLTQEMKDYCEQDVKVTADLYVRLLSEKFTEQSIDLEHRVHRICLDQKRQGFAFDVDGAWSLVNRLNKDRTKLEKYFQKVFPPITDISYFIPKSSNSRYGYTAGVPAKKEKTITFNPRSRQHIASRLKDKYGWKPDKFTASGQPLLDERVIERLPFDEAENLATYLLIQKRIAAISEAKQAWLNNVHLGRLHGSVITNGAVSGRATHRYPNLAQVPSTRVPYGADCRRLFCVPEGKLLVGSDVSGLELRALAHFLHPLDNGQYAEAVVNGDIHTFNQKLAGLETRDQAKTFIYALIYSAGFQKLGEVAGGNAATGKKLKTRFLKELPALSRLIKSVTNKATEKGYLLGLDKRKLRVRSPHSSLNLLIQSAGALLCKQWLVEIHAELQRRKLDDRCKQVAWVHDEVQFECDEDIADEFGQIAVRAIRDAGAHFGFRCELSAEYSKGKTWDETH